MSATVHSNVAATILPRPIKRCSFQGFGKLSHISIERRLGHCGTAKRPTQCTPFDNDMFEFGKTPNMMANAWQANIQHLDCEE